MWAPVGAAEGLVPFQYDVEVPEMKVLISDRTADGSCTSVISDEERNGTGSSGRGGHRDVDHKGKTV